MTIDVISIHKDSTNPPGTAWLNGVPHFTFDDTTDELFIISFKIPTGFSSGLRLKIPYWMDSATSNNVALRFEVKCVTAAENIETATFDTLEKTTDSAVPATAGLWKEIDHTITNDDSAAAGDMCEIKIGRENATTGTNATGDMFIRPTFEILYTTL
jgi:hypothetical protein